MVMFKIYSVWLIVPMMYDVVSLTTFKNYICQPQKVTPRPWSIQKISMPTAKTTARDVLPMYLD